jgi:DNA processing protein
MVTEAADVIAVLQPILGQPMPPRDAASVDLPGGDNPPKPAPSPGTDARDRLLVLLGPTPITLDDLARLSGLELPSLHGLLLELELAGRLIRHRGAMVSLATPTDAA